jgi:hypothetical protein
MLYTGSKWAKGCHPDTFMVEGGYTTSSKIVNDLIEKDGLESFNKILVMTEPECYMSVYDYETIFLQTNDIANNDNWLNGHNNLKPSYHSTTYKHNMLLKYGVENPMQSPTIRQAAHDTILERYGVSNISQNQSIKTKKEETCFSNYGVLHPLLSPINKAKAEETCLENWGEIHHMKSSEYIELYKTNILITKGVENVFQLESTKEKSKQTNRENHGVDFWQQSIAGREESSKRFRGSTYYNDGIKNFRIKFGDLPPDNLIKGKLVY